MSTNRSRVHPKYKTKFHAANRPAPTLRLLVCSLAEQPGVSHLVSHVTSQFPRRPSAIQRTTGPDLSPIWRDRRLRNPADIPRFS